MAIPSKEQMTGNNTTEKEFKEGLDQLLDNCSYSYPMQNNLKSEVLQNIILSGIWFQPSTAEATEDRGYPRRIAGKLQTFCPNKYGQQIITSEYHTIDGDIYYQTKYHNYNWQPWKRIATSVDLTNIDNEFNRTVRFGENLGTEHLNTVMGNTIRRQISNANATPEQGYPQVKNPAGILEQIERDGLKVREYMTWWGVKCWQIKYGNYDWQSWKIAATLDDIKQLQPYNGKTIAWFGDSIVEGNNHPLNVADKLGAKVHKFGFSSHMMSKYIDSPLGRDKGSMYRFAEAINTGDFSEVIAGGEWVRDNLKDDNMPQINAMAELDWNTVDYIAIAFGTNDIYSQTPLGELTDVPDSEGSTFIGATKYVIEQIQGKYPHIQIMFISPVFRTRWFQSPNPDRPEQNSDTLLDPQGRKYTDYIDALLHMRNEYHIPVFDFYRTSGINKLTWKKYLSDGVHPNASGVDLWTKKLKAFLLEN